MPTELALLSDAEPTMEVLAMTAAELHPDGSYIEYRGGEIKQFVAAGAVPLLSIFRTRPVFERREADPLLERPPNGYALWTDLTIPFNDDGTGRTLAQAIAERIGGVIHERV